MRASTESTKKFIFYNAIQEYKLVWCFVILEFLACMGFGIAAIVELFQQYVMSGYEWAWSFMSLMLLNLLICGVLWAAGTNLTSRKMAGATVTIRPQMGYHLFQVLWLAIFMGWAFFNHGRRSDPHLTAFRNHRYDQHAPAGLDFRHHLTDLMPPIFFLIRVMVASQYTWVEVFFGMPKSVVADSR